jgi:hypothetical protein
VQFVILLSAFLVNVTVPSHAFCNAVLVSESFNVRLTGGFAN